MGQAAGEFAAGLLQTTGDGPVFAADKGFYFIFALTDQAQRSTLYPARREARTHLAPEQRRQIEAHQIIEGAARLLGVDQIHGDFAGGGDSFLHGFFGDFVEDDTLRGLVAEQVTLAQQLHQMPGDGLAFAIRIGSEPELVGATQGLGDGVHMSLVALDGSVAHGEIMFGIYSTFFGLQIAHMAVGSEHLKVIPQILLDGFGFSRRFNDNELICHGSVKNPCAVGAQ